MNEDHIPADQTPERAGQRGMRGDAPHETRAAMAVVPVVNRLWMRELVETAAQHYRIAARLLKKMRTLAAGSEHEVELDGFIAELHETNRRRPRLQQEFDHAGLP